MRGSMKGDPEEKDLELPSVVGPEAAVESRGNVAKRGGRSFESLTQVLRIAY